MEEHLNTDQEAAGSSPAVPTKTCRICEVEKPLEAFRKNARGSYGRHAYCTPCDKERQADQYKTDSEYRQRRREHKKAAVQAARDYVNRLKRRPCRDCGCTYDPICMDFDHLGDDKLDNVSVLVGQGLSITKIAFEIAKCELVCANCHHIRTRDRRDRK